MPATTALLFDNHRYLLLNRSINAIVGYSVLYSTLLAYDLLPPQYLREFVPSKQSDRFLVVRFKFRKVQSFARPGEYPDEYTLFIIRFLQLYFIRSTCSSHIIGQKSFSNEAIQSYITLRGISQSLVLYWCWLDTNFHHGVAVDQDTIAHISTCNMAFYSTGPSWRHWNDFTSFRSEYPVNRYDFNHLDGMFVGVHIATFESQPLHLYAIWSTILFFFVVSALYMGVCTFARMCLHVNVCA